MNPKQKRAAEDASLPIDRILRADEVMELFGIKSRMTLDAWCRRGKLPAKRRIGVRAIGFLESEIAARLRSIEAA